MRAIRQCPMTPGSWLLAPLLAAALAVPAHAQDSVSTYVGEVVRIQYRGHADALYTGRLLAVDHDSVAIAPQTNPGARLSFVRSDLSRISVRDGRSRRTRAGLGIGLLVGGAVGAGVGALSYQPCSDCFLDFGRGFSTAMGAAAGGALGLVVGGIAGANTVREHWRASDLAPAVTLAPAVPMTPAGATRFGLALRVRLWGGPALRSGGA